MVPIVSIEKTRYDQLVGNVHALKTIARSPSFLVPLIFLATYAREVLREPVITERFRRHTIGVFKERAQYLSHTHLDYLRNLVALNDVNWMGLAEYHEDIGMNYSYPPGTLGAATSFRQRALTRAANNT